MPRKPRNPFEVTLDKATKDDFASWLSREIQSAVDARTVSDTDIQYFHQIYEQGRTRLARNMPWVDAADLTSYLGTEKVDAMRARIMKTIMVDPIWTVEGWGDAAARAPFVEEFHQWQAEQEGVQRAVYKAIHLSLIEPRGVLEVYEDTLERPVRKAMKAVLDLAEDGSAIIDENNQQKLAVGDDGRFVEAVNDQQPQAEIVVEGLERVRRGPQYRVVSYRDFLVLPAHVPDRNDVWGYGKRFFRRVADLKDRVADGQYDKDALDAMGTNDERGSATTLSGESIPVSTQIDQTAEKELWEVLFLYDFDGKGQRWYVVTIHVPSQTILRLQHDDVGKPRYVIFTPFPRPDRVDEGYSYVGNKLITVIEEHTAWRNMIADRAALAVQAPVKRLEGALWDAFEVPWGPKAVITVRDMRELEQVQIADVPQGAIEREREIKEAAERVGGLSDVVASGLQPQSSRTLGELQLRTEQTYVRMDEVIKQVQESMEDLGVIRHEIWKRALAEQETGIDAPQSVMIGLEARGVDITDVMPDKKFTASMLEGAFRFKPRGSVETADPARMRMDFAQSIQAIGMLAKVSPGVAAFLQGPKAAKALYEIWLRLYKVENKQAFLGSMSEAVQAMQQQQIQPPGPPGMGGAQPGAPGAAPVGNPGAVGPPPPAAPPTSGNPIAALLAQLRGRAA